MAFSKGIHLNELFDVLVTYEYAKCSCYLTMDRVKRTGVLIDLKEVMIKVQTQELRHECFLFEAKSHY